MQKCAQWIMLLEKWAIAITRLLRKMHLPLASLTYRTGVTCMQYKNYFSAVTLERTTSKMWGYALPLIYVRGTLDIRLVHSKIRWHIVLDMCKIVQRMRAFIIHVTHTLTIRKTFARCARQSLNTPWWRYRFVIRTLLKRSAYTTHAVPLTCMKTYRGCAYE